MSGLTEDSQTTTSTITENNTANSALKPHTTSHTTHNANINDDDSLDAATLEYLLPFEASQYDERGYRKPQTEVVLKKNLAQIGA